MHNRRFGALLIGAWFIGTVLVWFVSGQGIAIADNLAASPPLQIQREIADIGSDAARNLLRYEANEISRHVRETWEMLQIGLAAALFVTSFLTAHRTKTVTGAAVVLCALSAISAFYLTPAITTLGRSLDFLPLTAAPREREAYTSLQIWHRVVAILQLIVVLLVAVRLLFKFYEFREVVAPSHDGRRHRRGQRPPASPAPAE